MNVTFTSLQTVLYQSTPGEQNCFVWPVFKLSLYLQPSTVVGLFQQGLPCCTPGTEPFSALCARFVKRLGTFFFFFSFRLCREARRACEHSLHCDCEQIEWFSWKINRSRLSGSRVSHQKVCISVNKNSTSSCLYQTQVKRWIPLKPIPTPLLHTQLQYSQRNPLSITIITFASFLSFLTIDTKKKTQANVPINEPHILYPTQNGEKQKHNAH